MYIPTILTNPCKDVGVSFSESYHNHQPPKILVVEDNPLIQKITEDMLTRLGCTVTTVNDGLSALGSDILCYNLVLLDIGLPDVNGVEVCRTIRARYPNFSTPIVAYTACGNIMEQQCRAVGISEFMVKPVSPQDFAALLKRLLGWKGNV